MVAGLLLAFSLIAGNSVAADLIVQEAGPVGTYASIASAVAASTDGDRIIINNKPGGSPWNENIVINKSLTFLSAVDNARFFVQGNYTIVHAPGREVTIIGMENVSGSIASTANGSTSRTIVNIMSCKLSGGSLSFPHTFFGLNASNNEVSAVSFVYGMVVGNQIYSDISLNSDAIVGNDSIQIVGNQTSSIYAASTSHYVYISNNFVSNPILSAVTISLQNCKNGTGVNVIRNNSIRTSYFGISIGSSCAGFIRVYNNIIQDYNSNGDYGIRNFSAANLIVSFNFITSTGWDNTSISGFPNDGTNVLSNSVALNGDGSSAWVGTIDGGSPAVEDTDLDLTRNDPGCFGGSYSHANFFPINGPSSKVYYLKMPTQILVGGSNAVTGYSFDR